LDEAYLRDAITRALAKRNEYPASRFRPAAKTAGAKEARPSLDNSTPIRRLVWSESDDLPGVVVDQFGDVLVVQIQSLAMEQRSSLLGDVLASVVKPEEIVFRND